MTSKAKAAVGFSLLLAPLPLQTLGLLILAFFTRGRARAASIAFFCASFALLAFSLLPAAPYFTCSPALRSAYPFAGAPYESLPANETYECQVAGSQNFSLSTDALGRRKNLPAVPGQPLLVFSGCSFTFGVGVNDSDTLPSQLAATGKHSVVNLGTPGGGLENLVLQAIFLKEFVPEAASANGVTFVYTLLPEHLLALAQKGPWGWQPRSTRPRVKIFGNGTFAVDAWPNKIDLLRWKIGNRAVREIYKRLYADALREREAKPSSEVILPVDIAGAAAALNFSLEKLLASGPNRKFLLNFEAAPETSAKTFAQDLKLLQEQLLPLLRPEIEVLFPNLPLDSSLKSHYGHPEPVFFENLSRKIQRRLSH